MTAAGLIAESLHLHLHLHLQKSQHNQFEMTVQGYGSSLVVLWMASYKSVLRDSYLNQNLYFFLFNNSSIPNLISVAQVYVCVIDIFDKSVGVRTTDQTVTSKEGGVPFLYD